MKKDEVTNYKGGEEPLPNDPNVFLQQEKDKQENIKKTKSQDIPMEVLGENSTSLNYDDGLEKEDEKEEERPSETPAGVLPNRSQVRENQQVEEAVNIINVRNKDLFAVLAEAYFQKYAEAHQSKENVYNNNGPLIFPSQVEANSFLSSQATAKKEFLVREINGAGEHVRYSMSCGTGGLFQSDTLEGLKSLVDGKLNSRDPKERLSFEDRQKLEAESNRLNTMISKNTPEQQREGREVEPENLNNTSGKNKDEMEIFRRELETKSSKRESFFHRIYNTDTQQYHYFYSFGTNNLFENTNLVALKEDVTLTRNRNIDITNGAYSQDVDKPTATQNITKLELGLKEIDQQILKYPPSIKKEEEAGNNLGYPTPTQRFDTF